uniref:CD-NTase-associated protein 12/Pycsar effector protein TIR domain-containing protein n=1 Tax=Rhodopseudomonas palustris (strain BisA53) TaxID=316055 RepID=Q07LD9_RHOP5
MAKINQALIERLGSKLGIGDKAVYARIAKVVNETALDRHLAALLLAMRNGINVHRFSTEAQRAEVRGALRNGREHEFNSADSGSEMVERAVQRRSAKASKQKPAKKRTIDNTIFVVHGRDEALRRSMFDFLRALDLNPKEWDHVLREARGNNPYIGNVLDEVMEKAQAVVVMLTPDDLVQLKDQFVGRDEKNTEGYPLGQARPNVLFEAGLAMGRHPEKTVLVQIGRVKPFSDVGGRHILRLSESTESRNDLANRLEKIGCKVNRIGRDWMKAGDFVPTEPKAAKKR